MFVLILNDASSVPTEKRSILQQMLVDEFHIEQTTADNIFEESPAIISNSLNRIAAERLMKCFEVCGASVELLEDYNILEEVSEEVSSNQIQKNTENVSTFEKDTYEELTSSVFEDTKEFSYEELTKIDQELEDLTSALDFAIGVTPESVNEEINFEQIPNSPFKYQEEIIKTEEAIQAASSPSSESSNKSASPFSFEEEDNEDSLPDFSKINHKDYKPQRTLRTRL